MMVDGERKKLQELSVLYGSHMAMRRVIEGTMLGQIQRPSGHRSSMFGLQQHLGRLEEIDDFDLLNDPSEMPTMLQDSRSR